MRTLYLALLAAAALLPVAASSQQPAAAAPQCFYERDWNGWKAIDDKAMYIRVHQHEIYRVGFEQGCPGLTSASAHLVTHSRTGGNVCSALDLDIKVLDLQGFSTPCIATSLTPLTPADIAALPKRALP